MILPKDGEGSADWGYDSSSSALGHAWSDSDRLTAEQENRHGHPWEVLVVPEARALQIGALLGLVEKHLSDQHRERASVHRVLDDAIEQQPGIFSSSFQCAS